MPILAIYSDQRGHVVGVEAVSSRLGVRMAIAYAIDHFLALDLVDQDSAPESGAYAATHHQPAGSDGSDRRKPSC